LTPKEPLFLPLSVGTFLLLRDLIRDRLGVWYEEEKRDLLAAKMSDRLGALGFRTYLDYYYRLKYGPDADVEWSHLTDALSVQETYFWREMDQVRAFVDVLLPKVVEKNRGTVRVWSAACATGEEPLTLAMALNEAGWFERANIEIWASDISAAALEKAAQGVYRNRSFRALPVDLREKYFSPVDGEWRVDPALQRRIHYRRANLLDEEAASLSDGARFIFCRNVFIYFSRATIARVVAGFAERMARPGCLFVGVSESLLRASAAFELEQVGEAFVYVKK
jgi:chemotaxis protein methyltransferase CheR